MDALLKEDFLVHLQECLEEAPEIATLLVAYSGGLDSQVLLALAQQSGLAVRAVHINHQLSPHANSWQTHCENYCQQAGIPLHVEHLKLDKATGESVEALAREARYQVFAQQINETTALLTAHHQQDQAETLLLQLFRGAGPKGLRGIAKKTILGSGKLLRPLLPFTKQQLHRYAVEAQLTWVEDESNQILDFRRNYIRHKIIPQLQENISPSINKILCRTATLCATEHELLEFLLEEKWQQVQGKQKQQLKIAPLKQFPGAMIAALLRRWFAENKVALPTQKKLEHILSDALHCAPDKSPQVQWGKVSVRRYRDYLYLVHDIANYPEWVQEWDLQAPLQLPGNLGQLVARKTAGCGLQINSGDLVQVGFRSAGLTIQPIGREGHHRLKKLFQEWGVPPWQRQRVPLIFINNQLAMIVGHCLSQEFMSTSADAVQLVVELSAT